MTTAALLRAQVLAVRDETAGSQVTLAAKKGAPYLYVSDLGGFSATGGTVVINGVPATYSGFDATRVALSFAENEPSPWLFTGGLPFNVAAESVVQPTPPAVTRWATVIDGNGGPFEARVRHGVKSRLHVGTRSALVPGDMEWVTVEEDADIPAQFAVKDVHNSENKVTDSVLVSGKFIAPARTGWRAEMGDATYPLRYWDGTTTKFSVDNAGNVVIAGAVTSGGTITGATIVGGMIYSPAQTGWRAEMGDATHPLRYWDGTTTKFSVDTAGNVVIVGSVRTGEPGSAHWELLNTTMMGHLPGYLNPASISTYDVGGSQAALDLAPPATLTGYVPTLRLMSGPASSSVLLTADLVQVSQALAIAWHAVVPAAPGGGGVVLFVEQTGGHAGLAALFPTGGVRVLVQDDGAMYVENITHHVTGAATTAGYVLKALSTTTFGWGAVGFVDLTGTITAAQHGTFGTGNLHTEYAQLGAANVFGNFVQTFDRTTASGTVVTLVNTATSTAQPGGVQLLLRNTDTTPGNWAKIEFQSVDSGAAVYTLGRVGIQAQVHTAGAQNSDFVVTLMSAGAVTERFRVDNAGLLSLAVANWGAPSAVALVAVTGALTTFSRSDHVHAHGSGYAGGHSDAFTNPMTTLGDVIYGGAAGAATRLPGNTTTTAMYLRSTGSGGLATAPAFAQVGFTDVSGTITTTQHSTFATGNLHTEYGQLAAPNTWTRANTIAPTTTSVIALQITQADAGSTVVMNIDGGIGASGALFRVRSTAAGPAYTTRFSIGQDGTLTIDAVNWGIPVATGTANAQGAATTFAASNHVHLQGIVATKGALLGFSTLPVAHPVGVDNAVLVADSLQADGLRWSSAVPVVRAVDVTVPYPPRADYVTYVTDAQVTAASHVVAVAGDETAGTDYTNEGADDGLVVWAKPLAGQVRLALRTFDPGNKFAGAFRILYTVSA